MVVVMSPPVPGDPPVACVLEVVEPPPVPWPLVCVVVDPCDDDELVGPAPPVPVPASGGSEQLAATISVRPMLWAM
jgi:hypothetical protein